MKKIMEYFEEKRKQSMIASAIVLVILTLFIILIANTTKSDVVDKETTTKEEITYIDSETTAELSSDEETTTQEETTKKVKKKKKKKTTTENKEDSESKDKNEEETTVNKEETTENNSNFSAKGQLKVKGTHLVDSNGNIVQLKGLSTHGIGWFPDYINNECFKQFKNDFGINVIRLAMYTEEYNGYCSGGNKDALIDLVDKGVKYATDNGLYVIIDWHILSDNNPNMHTDEAIKYFDRMSKKYDSYTNVIYEICNEPNGGTSFAEVKRYATEVIKTIRKNDKDAVILVGTPNWCQFLMDAANDPITGYDNIMYTLHFYAATHKDDLRNTLKSALAKGLPVFVSEFGICDASGNGVIDEVESEKWISLLNQNGISYVMWNISNKAETSSIFNASCNKHSGFDENDLSASGKWFLKMMKGKIDLSKYNEETTKDGSTNPTTKKETQTTKAETETTTAKTSTIIVKGTIKANNSWESNGKKYTQYTLTVKNTSGKACTAWKCDISFDKTITFDSGWNGKFTASGKTLHIESVEHNGELAAGESKSDIGFIVAQ